MKQNILRARCNRQAKKLRRVRQLTFNSRLHEVTILAFLGRNPSRHDRHGEEITTNESGERYICMSGARGNVCVTKRWINRQNHSNATMDADYMTNWHGQHAMLFIFCHATLFGSHCSSWCRGVKWTYFYHMCLHSKTTWMSIDTSPTYL